MGIDPNLPTTNINTLEQEKFAQGSDGKVRTRTLATITGPQIDMFGRVRTSTPYDIFDHKNVASRGQYIMDEVTSGTGGIAWDRQNSAVNLTTGTASGDRALRQSRYCFYIPGKSQNIEMTGELVESGADANCTRRIGYFDDNNGLFYEYDGTTVNIVKRSNTTGSIVEERVAQSDWNIDKMDGTGPSGLTADWSKSIIYKTNFQWLGVGSALMSIVINGAFHNLHIFHHSNLARSVYMRTPTLPLRYEIVNTGTVAATQTLVEFCMSCSSEAGAKPYGLQFHTNTKGHATVTNDVTEVDVLAIRLKNTLGGYNNRITAILENMVFFAADADTVFELYKIYEPTVATTTWADVNTQFSGMEYAVNSAIGSITGTEVMIDCSIVPSTSKTGAGSIDSLVNALNENISLRQNYDSTNSSIFILRALSMGGAGIAGGAFTWTELE